MYPKVAIEKKIHIDHIVVWCETKLNSTLIVNSCSCISLRCVALWMAVVFFSLRTCFAWFSSISISNSLFLSSSSRRSKLKSVVLVVNCHRSSCYVPRWNYGKQWPSIDSEMTKQCITTANAMAFNSLLLNKWDFTTKYNAKKGETHWTCLSTVRWLIYMEHLSFTITKQTIEHSLQ